MAHRLLSFQAAFSCNAPVVKRDSRREAAALFGPEVA